MMRVLHLDLWQFSNSFLFDIFQKIIPERNDFDILIVKLDFLTIWSVNYKSFDFYVVVVFENFPAVSVYKLIIAMLC